MSNTRFMYRIYRGNLRHGRQTPFYPGYIGAPWGHGMKYTALPHNHVSTDRYPLKL